MSNMFSQHLLIFSLVGIMGGIIGVKSHIPGGALIGSMVAVIMLKVFIGKGWVMPKWYATVAEIMIGIVIGASYRPGIFELLKRLMLPVIASTLMLIIMGFVVSVVLVKLGILDGTTAYLSTSPGAMTALLSIAGEKVATPLIVLVFHFFRIVFIIVTAPLIIYVFQKFIDT